MNTTRNVIVCVLLITVTSWAIKSNQARYLLVDVNPNARFVKSNVASIKGSNARILFRSNVTPYEGKKIQVPKSKPKCTDDKAKKDGYYIGKGKPETHTYRFVAKHEWDDSPNIAELNANQGECNKLSTEEKSQKCGIGNQLMMLCLEDEDVTKHGGLNPLTYNDKNEADVEYAVWRDKEFGKLARKLCLAIVFITCAPGENTTKYACKTYIEAAKAKGYQLLFADNYMEDEYSVLETKEAERMFKNNPDDFISSLGDDWFFCKCKRGGLQDCKKLQEHKHNVDSDL